ncbi:MAG: hypothetical protein JNK89_07855, partial [Saprospiraceae bacterium]|nr:hypothetical protein [Saprospiraceae bacterium]
MSQPTGQFPDETYFHGLRDNPDSSLAVVYDEFRQVILEKLGSVGCPADQAGKFFQLAVFDLSRLAREGKIPAETSVQELLETLAQQHFALSQGSGFETAAEKLTEEENLRRTQQKFEAWNRLEQLDADCRRKLLQPVDDTSAGLPIDQLGQERLNTCTAEFRQLLPAAELPETGLPDWARAALADPAGYTVWQRASILESDWSTGLPAPAESNRIWRWAIGIFLIAVVGYGIYHFYARPTTAAEVFADNFDPPGSFMEDLRGRYGDEMGNDSVAARPSTCLLLLREADAYYQANEYQAAVDPLLLIVLDSASICHSDAWFFLSILHLKLDDPSTAIQCLAKIDDLGHYGQDLYWYQALAFVQLAKEN